MQYFNKYRLIWITRNHIPTNKWVHQIEHPNFNNMGGSKNTRTNSYFLKNASYLRLKNLTVGYTIPKVLTEKARMQKVRFYFSGDNLFTFTKFKGLDPERADDGESIMYPQNRICSIGVNVEF